ncbi:MAG: nuclear transport factor 2 family protein [Parasphingorhabdus sp.]
MSDISLSDLSQRLERLESESAIRQLMARYFQICDDLGPDTPLDDLGELFTIDALWEGKGRYAKAFGGYQGRDAIVAMIGSYCAPDPHFAMTGHFFSAEDIQVSGATASGAWMMLQCSTYADDKSDLRSACLNIDFRNEDGTWRISRFRSTNIFARRVDRWTDAEDIPVPDNSKDGAIK